MKPTVISGGDSNTAHNNPAPNNNNNSNYQQDGDNNNPNVHTNQRQFPSHFQSGFGFGPSLVDDMFADDDFRPHAGTRMRDPWGFGARKRCGNLPNEDPYSRYFADESDLFPGFQDPEWETMRGRRRVAPQHQNTAPTGAEPRSNFFDYIPAQFRSYIPDNFGFTNIRSNPNTTASSAADHSQSYPPHPQQHYEARAPPQQANHPAEAQPQYQQQQPQYQQQQPQYQQQQPQYQHQPAQQQQHAPRPKFCDASIQTEDDLNVASENTHIDQNQNLNQHGLRNTVDLGQKSPQEECREPRAHSAPPINDANQNFASSSAFAYGSPGDAQSSATAYASTGTNPRTPQQSSAPQQPAFNTQQRPQPNNPPPPPQRHHIPQYQIPPQYQQQQAAPRTPPHEDESGFVRHVPIFIEGRSKPVNTPQQQRKGSGPKPQPQQEHHRPTPLNTQQAQAQAQTQEGPVSPSSEVPSTPHTAASINKIQSIQRDVLNLMTQVEQFKGAKRDKEYIYLDEMLTRNLLKLDTIDTNGKDSIRLARREAIKCIEASINVLEAKAEENAKTAQNPVIDLENNNTANEAEPAADTKLATEAEVPTGKVSSEPPEDPSKSKGVVVQEDSGNQKEEVAAKSSEVPKDDSKKLELEADKKSELSAGEKESNPSEPSTESTENTASEKENKPPGSPKKKVVRKVKKVGEKKDVQDEAAPSEAEVPKAIKTESTAADNAGTVEINDKKAEKQ